MQFSVLVQIVIRQQLHNQLLKIIRSLKMGEIHTIVI